MDKFIPALGIIVVSVILVVINEFTDMTFIRDYALLFIISGMFLGVGLTRLGRKLKKGDTSDESGNNYL